MAEDSISRSASPLKRTSTFIAQILPQQHAYTRMDGDDELHFTAANPTVDSSMTYGSVPGTLKDMPSPVRTKLHEGDAQNSPVDTPDITATPPPLEEADLANSMQTGVSKQPKLPRQAKFTELFRGTSRWGKSNPRSRSQDPSDGKEPFRVDYPGFAEDPSLRYPDAEYSNKPKGTDELALRYAQPPECRARQDPLADRKNGFWIMILVLSIISTSLSGLWLFVAFKQPRWGRKISSSNGSGIIAASTASIVTALLAKITELTFATVFVAVIGQSLTRRTFEPRSKGMTLSEMTMRNWILQPGTIVTQWREVSYSGKTILGFLTIAAALSGTLYTTASDAMVTPKLKLGAEESKLLRGVVQASYANPTFVKESCTTPINQTLDFNNSGYSCLDVQYSGSSYRNLLEFMKTWQTTNEHSTAKTEYLRDRPVGTALLYDNTALISSWIDTENGDVAKKYDTHRYIINNVTLAMPHASVYQAATDPINGILQPNDLDGVGEYQIKASVVSPVVNVMCVNMDLSDLAPLVYTTWPNARNEYSGTGLQLTGRIDWDIDVPKANDTEFLNRTVVDDIFEWGPKWNRRPPVFPMFPANYNMITNTTVWPSEKVPSDSIYILAKSAHITNYTLCQLRSWSSTKCSTEFSISGIKGAHMKAHCEDPGDVNAYHRSDPNAAPVVMADWRNLADQWRLSMDLNGGTANNNASNARIITNLVLQSPQLDPVLPSTAEALAVLASSTLVFGALGSTFKHFWGYNNTRLDEGIYETFNASIKSQEYTCGHINDWQGAFYVVLAVVFILNLLCLAFWIKKAKGSVTDFTEPKNMFALAINSPPSKQLAGSCGGGPENEELLVQWRIKISESSDHYYLEAASNKPPKSRFSHQSTSSSVGLLGDGHYRKSFNRLSAGRQWF